MCNLYSMTKNQAAIRNLFKVDRDSTGNLPSMPGIFPDYPAPIVRNADGGRELALARWGMPSSQLAQMQAAKKRAAKLEAKLLEIAAGIIDARGSVPVGRWNDAFRKAGGSVAEYSAGRRRYAADGRERHVLGADRGLES